MVTKEKWVSIAGFVGFYEVSSHGRVRGISTDGNWRRKRGILTGYGGGKLYPHVLLTADGKRVTRNIHRLVAEAFIPNPENFPQINHKDANKENNRVDNLEWCTCQQNQAHARSKQLQRIPKGTQCWNAKLTDDKVRTMRHRYQTEGITYKELAAEYGVHSGVVGMIIRREKWKHVL